MARWKVEGLESDVLEELSSTTEGPTFESRAGGGVVATLGLNATLTVKGATAEVTLLSFEQVREPEAIRTTIQNRATR